MRAFVVCLGLGITSLFFISLFHQVPPETAPLSDTITLPTQKHPEIEPQQAEINQSETLQKENIQSAFVKKHFKKALALVHAELDSYGISTSYRNWLTRQIPIIYSSQGWQLLQDQKCDEAFIMFDKALHHGSAPFAFKGIGTCAYQNQDYWQAELYLRKFFEVHGFELDGLLLLLDVLESLNQFDQAEQLLARSIKQKTLKVDERDILTQKLASMREKHRESYHQTSLSGSYITISYRAIEHDELGPWALQELEQSVDEFFQNFSLPRPTGTIEAVLYPVEAFKKLSHTPFWVSGLFDGRIRIPVPLQQENIDYNKVSRILRHELTHALLTEASGAGILPTWFHEGLASLLECHPYCQNRPFSPSVNRDQFLPMEKLESSFFALSQLEINTAYAQSYHLIQTIIKIEGTSGIRSLIENIQPNIPQNSQTLLKPLGMSADDVFHMAAKNWLSEKKF